MDMGLLAGDPVQMLLSNPCPNAFSPPWATADKTIDFHQCFPTLGAIVRWVLFLPVPVRCLPFPPYEPAGAVCILAVITLRHWSELGHQGSASSLPSGAEFLARVVLPDFTPRSLCRKFPWWDKEVGSAASLAVQVYVSLFSHLQGCCSVLLGVSSWFRTASISL